jgi:hypothetical protein
MAARVYSVMLTLIPLLGLVLIGIPPPDENAGAPPLPTMQDLHDMYDQGDYRTCLQQAARVTRLPVARQTLDKDEVNLLRGKSLIALRDSRSALRALEPVLKSTTPQFATEARALTALVRASPGVKYTIKSGPKFNSIDLADPANLKPGMLALLNDQLIAIEPEVRAALAANNLAPLPPLAPRILDLYALEQTATGASDRTATFGTPLGEHARELIKNELAERDREITVMESMANELYDTGGRGRRGWWWNNGVTRRGLVSDQRDRLDDMVDYLAKIEQTALKGQDISRAVNGNVGAWDEVLADAKRVRQHAQDVLDSEGIRTTSSQSP